MIVCRGRKVELDLNSEKASTTVASAFPQTEGIKDSRQSEADTCPAPYQDSQRPQKRAASGNHDHCGQSHVTTRSFPGDRGSQRFWNVRQHTTLQGHMKQEPNSAYGLSMVR